MDYHLRYMLLQDVEMVQQIDHEAFPPTSPRPRFKREIMSKNARYLVVSSGKPPQISARKELNSDPIDRPSGLKSWITGVINQLKKPQRFVGYTSDKILGFVGILLSGDESHITAIAADLSQRGKGVGELLLIGVIKLSWLEKIQTVTLEVRVSNHVSQSLYKKYGFAEQGIRKRYYLDNHEDAIIMSTPSINSLEYREKFEILVKTFEGRWGNSGKILHFQ